MKKDFFKLETLVTDALDDNLMAYVMGGGANRIVCTGEFVCVGKFYDSSCGEVQCTGKYVASPTCPMLGSIKP